MGYGICRPSLGPVMVRVRILAAVHFVFGVIYSIGTVRRRRLAGADAH